MICKEIRDCKGVNVNTGMETLIVQKRDIWCFQVMCNRMEPCNKREMEKAYRLLDEEGNILDDVIDFMKKVADYQDIHWILATGKRLIAFKNFADRTIYIYSKIDFKSRFDNEPSIYNCKTIIIE